MFCPRPKHFLYSAHFIMHTRAEETEKQNENTGKEDVNSQFHYSHILHLIQVQVNNKVKNYSIL